MDTTFEAKAFIAEEKILCSIEATMNDGTFGACRQFTHLKAEITSPWLAAKVFIKIIPITKFRKINYRMKIALIWFIITSYPSLGFSAETEQSQLEQAAWYKSSTSRLQEYADRVLYDHYEYLRVEYPDLTAKQRADRLYEEYPKFYNLIRDSENCMINGNCNSGSVQNLADLGAAVMKDYFKKGSNTIDYATKQFKADYADKWSQNAARDLFIRLRENGHGETNTIQFFQDLQKLTQGDKPFIEVYNKLRGLYAPKDDFVLGGKAPVTVTSQALMSEIEAIRKEITLNKDGQIDQTKLSKLLDEKLKSLNQDIDNQFTLSKAAAKQLAAELQGQIKNLTNVETRNLLESKLANGGIDAVLKELSLLGSKMAAGSEEEQKNTKAILDAIKPLTKYIKEQEVRQKQEDKKQAQEAAYQTALRNIDEYNATVNLVGYVVGIKDPELGNQISKYSAIITNLAKAQAAFSVEQIGPAVLTGNYVAGAIQLISLLSDKKSPSEAAVVLQALARLGDQIQKTRQEMHARFDAIDHKIDYSLDMVTQQLNIIKSSVLNTEIIAGESLRKIHTLDTHVALFSSEILDAVSSSLAVEMAKCSSRISNPKDQLTNADASDFFATALTWSTQIAVKPPFVKKYSPSRSPTEILGWYSRDKDTLDAAIAEAAGNFGFTATYLSSLSGIECKRPVNLVEWLRGYRMASYLRNRFPDATDDGQLESLKKQADEVQEYLLALHQESKIRDIIKSLKPARENLRRMVIEYARDYTSENTAQKLLPAYSPLSYEWTPPAAAAPVRHSAKKGYKSVDTFNKSNEAAELDGNKIRSLYWKSGAISPTLKRAVALGYLEWDITYSIQSIEFISYDRFFKLVEEKPGFDWAEANRGRIIYSFKPSFTLTAKATKILNEAAYDKTKYPVIEKYLLAHVQNAVSEAKNFEFPEIDFGGPGASENFDDKMPNQPEIFGGYGSPFDSFSMFRSGSVTIRDTASIKKSPFWSKSPAMSQLSSLWNSSSPQMRQLSRPGILASTKPYFESILLSLPIQESSFSVEEIFPFSGGLKAPDFDLNYGGLEAPPYTGPKSPYWTVTYVARCFLRQFDDKMISQITTALKAADLSSVASLDVPKKALAMREAYDSYLLRANSVSNILALLYAGEIGNSEVLYRVVGSDAFGLESDDFDSLKKFKIPFFTSNQHVKAAVRTDEKVIVCSIGTGDFPDALIGNIIQDENPEMFSHWLKWQDAQDELLIKQLDAPPSFPAVLPFR